MYQIYVMNAYRCQANEWKKVTNYPLPTVWQKICLKVWIEVFVLTRRKFNTWCGSVGPYRSILTLGRDPVGLQGNNYETFARDVVSKNVQTIYAVDVPVVNVFVRREDGQYNERCSDTEMSLYCHHATEWEDYTMSSWEKKIMM